jgi:hypothetical protein
MLILQLQLVEVFEWNIIYLFNTNTCAFVKLNELLYLYLSFFFYLFSENFFISNCVKCTQTFLLLLILFNIRGKQTKINKI